MNRIAARVFPLFVLILNACASPAPSTTAAPTWTPDPCASSNASESVKPINNLMREFDDASALASNLPATELDEAILNLQRIRREAENIQAPVCLIELQKYQVAHMNAVIDTLIAFLGGANTEALNQGLVLAREQHDLYTVEMARVLGVTLVPATPAVP